MSHILWWPVRDRDWRTLICSCFLGQGCFQNTLFAQPLKRETEKLYQKKGMKCCSVQIISCARSKQLLLKLSWLAIFKVTNYVTFQTKKFDLPLMQFIHSSSKWFIYLLLMKYLIGYAVSVSILQHFLITIIQTNSPLKIIPTLAALCSVVAQRCKLKKQSSLYPHKYNKSCLCPSTGP